MMAFDIHVHVLTYMYSYITYTLYMYIICRSKTMRREVLLCCNKMIRLYVVNLLDQRYGGKRGGEVCHLLSSRK